MRVTDRESLIDLIYEATAIPDRWPTVLGHISDIAECEGAALFTIDTAQNIKMATTGIHTVRLPKMINDGWMDKNTRVHRAAAKNHAGFLTDQDLFTLEEMRADPLFDYLRANGAGWGAGTIIPAPTGDIITFAVDRAHNKGPVRQKVIAELDEFRPHLARAGLLACRMRLEQARNMVAALELIGLPATVLKADGRILAANALLNAFDSRLVFRASDQISFSNLATDNLFKEILSRLRVKANIGMHSIPLPAEGSAPPAILHIVPIKGDAADIFGFASNLVMITPLTTPNAPSEQVLNGLFDLTPAEARVAQALVRGKTVDEIATDFGVATATVRTQLKSVLHKTGMHRQSELVGLLAGRHPIDG